jgi:uncharacterized protein YjeT (DUF2065 family)
MTSRQQKQRVLVVGICALVVGALASLLKGNGDGLLGAMSEAASPWLLLGFVGGAYAGKRRLGFGALCGLEATILGLLGFYFVNSFVVHFGPYGWFTDLHLAALSGVKYFALAIVSGTTFGALGAWWRRQLSPVLVVAVGLLFIVEGLVRAMTGPSWDQYVDQVAAIEVVVGLLWMAVALTKTRSLRRESKFSDAPLTKV